VVEATELAKEAGETLMQNIVMVGCLVAAGFTPLKVETVMGVIKEIFAEKNPEMNLKAFELGMKEMGRIKPL
jgi:indolepyruvate ferredoxin oxidoreductase beta subunit